MSSRKVGVDEIKMLETEINEFIFDVVEVMKKLDLILKRMRIFRQSLLEIERRLVSEE